MSALAFLALVLVSMWGVLTAMFVLAWVALAIRDQVVRARRAKESERVRRSWEQVLAVKAARARNAKPAPRVSDFPRKSER